MILNALAIYCISLTSEPMGPAVAVAFAGLGAGGLVLGVAELVPTQLVAVSAAVDAPLHHPHPTLGGTLPRHNSLLHAIVIKIYF